MSVKSIFSPAMRDPMKVYARKLEWANGSGSDLIAIYNAFRIWSFKHNSGAFGTGNNRQAEEEAFCANHYLEVRSLHECNLLVNELKERLSRLHITVPTGVNRVVWTDQMKSLILKIVVGGAFYPNLYQLSSTDKDQQDRSACKHLYERDARNTVFFQGFHQKYVRELYTKPIKELFCGPVVEKSELKNVKVSFGRGSERVFVTFENKSAVMAEGDDWETRHSKLPGNIPAEVYKAVKMREAKLQRSIKVAP